MLPRNFVATAKHTGILKKLNVLTVQKAFSSQVQEVNANVREYDETPKPVKHRTLKKFKEPFPKGFFVGKCDPEVLEYPEVLNLEEIDKVNSHAQQILSFIKNTKESSHTITKKLIKEFAETGIFGARVGYENWGHGYTNTETTVVNEATAQNSALFKFNAEQQVIAYNILFKHGSAQQKSKYLNQVLKGETIVSCAFQERPSSSDADISIRTLALSDGEDGFEISGCKDWVYNAPLADVIIVFANTNTKDDTGQRMETLSAFIIPSNTPGVTIHPPLRQIGVRGVPISKVEFLNVRVGKNEIIGDVNNGADILLNAVASRLNIAPYVVGVGKQLLNDVTLDSIHSSFMATPKEELEGVRARLGKMATVLYTLESCVYLQAGHADIYENPDTFLETTITKVLASKVLTYLTNEVIGLIGSEGLVREDLSYLHTLVQNCAFYSVCDETNINLMNNIALVGLGHAGAAVHEEVKKIRNPLMFPSFIFKKILEGKKKYGGEKGIKLGLAGYLHPSLESAAGVLEYCISRVHMGSDALLARYGKEIVEKHMELQLIAEATILTYALTAVLARASRSYCIGLAESETEIEIALAVAAYSEKKMEKIVTELIEGPLLHNSNKYMRISQRIIANKGYCSQPPITRNF